MESAIYEGTVRHRRTAPVAHAFSYSTYMLYLDLDEVPDLFHNCACCAHEQFGIASYHRADYLGPKEVPLKEAVQRRVRESTGHAVNGPIRMLTTIRSVGYGFNPVTFYYCFEADCRQLAAIVAEITNTPWNERHCYVLPRSKSLTPRNFRFRFDKQFHISPFIGMDARYDWRFTPPGEHLLIHMENSTNTSRYFDSTLRLTRHDFSAARLARMQLKYPLLPLKVSAGIYFQALKLRMKGCPVHPHPRLQQSTTQISSNPRTAP